MVLCRSGSFGLENVRYPFGLSLSKPGLARWFGRCACVECGGRVVAPAGDSLFFASPKKSKQKKGDPQSATPTRCVGANLRRGGCGVRRGTRFAPAARRSDNHGESVHEAWALRRPCYPRNRPDAGASSRGWTAEHPNGHTGHCFARPHLAGASATRCANWAERSNGPNGCPLPGFPSGCAEERSGQRIRARDCLSATKWSEFERDPAGREHRRLPAAKRRDAACRVAFSLVTFSWRRKRKLLRRRAHPPAPALGKGMGIDQRRASTSSARMGRGCQYYKNNSCLRLKEKRQRPKTLKNSSCSPSKISTSTTAAPTSCAT